MPCTGERRWSVQTTNYPTWLVMHIVKDLIGGALTAVIGGWWAARRARRKSLPSAPSPQRVLGATPWDMLIAALASNARTMRLIAIAFALLGMVALITWILYH
jgi:hypothetical protein